VGCRGGGGATATGRGARTAASFWVFLTLGATFFWRAGAALRATGFFRAFFSGLALAAGAFRLATGLAAPRVALRRVVAARVDFFAADFGAVALFAFGFADLDDTVRLLGAALPEVRRPPELDLRKPFAAGLLIW